MLFPGSDLNHPIALVSVTKRFIANLLDLADMKGKIEEPKKSMQNKKITTRSDVKVY